jgi:hypothetical protein
MSGSESSPGTMPGDQQAVLRNLLALLRSIGSANDAEDHGYLEDAGRMRAASCESIRGLLAEHPFLGELLPALQEQLDAGRILGIGWADLCDQVEKILPADSGENGSSLPCETCSSLADQEYAYQKYGAELYDTHLPLAAGDLQVVRDFNIYGTRKRQLWQCPACGTYYLYRTDYEYLVNGSEDEEFLTRLTEEQARQELKQAQE